MRLRDPQEIRFRAEQELTNLRMWVRPPRLKGPVAPSPLAGLPVPDEVATKLQSTQFALEVAGYADQILAGQYPLLGITLHLPLELDWRSDHLHQITSPAKYFRRIPYLNFAAVGDHKVIWELNRQQHLVLLAQAWVLDRQPKYLDEIWRQLRSWLKQNPFAHGINWTSALEVAFRALSWLWLQHMIGREMPVELSRAFLNSLYQHGCFLEHNLSVYFSPNTHLLGEAVALHALGKLLPDWPRAAHWRELGGDWTAQQLDFQVRDDGSHFEQSSYYHVYALDMFLFHCALAEMPAQASAKLVKMAVYLRALMGPARILSFFGDDDGGRCFYPYGNKAEFGRATLATAAQLLGMARGGCAEDRSAQADWWLKDSPPSHDVPVSPAAELLFPDAGVTTATRNCAGRAAHLVFKHGGMGWAGAGHSHADLLSVTLRLGAEELLIDPATFTYLSDPAARDWFRSSEAHNTARLNGIDQAEPQTPFRWESKPQAVSDGAWTGHANYRGVSHRRRIDWRDDSLIVIRDEFELAATDAAPHLMEQFWHTGVPIKMLSPVLFQLGEKARLHLNPGATVTWEEGGRSGWRSRGLLQKEPAPALCATLQAPLPAVITAVVDLDGKYDRWPL